MHLRNRCCEPGFAEFGFRAQVADGLIVPILVGALPELLGDLFALSVIETLPTWRFRKNFERVEIGLHATVESGIVAPLILSLDFGCGFGDRPEFTKERIALQQVV